mgnify:CR=1 FL=1
MLTRTTSGSNCNQHYCNFSLAKLVVSLLVLQSGPEAHWHSGQAVIHPHLNWRGWAGKESCKVTCTKHLRPKWQALLILNNRRCAHTHEHKCTSKQDKNSSSESAVNASADAGEQVELDTALHPMVENAYEYDST